MSCPYPLAMLFGGGPREPPLARFVGYQTSSVLRQTICGRTFSRGRSAIMP